MTEGSTVVLGQVPAGMGGAGKTQLAANHARATWDSDEVAGPGTAVPQGVATGGHRSGRHISDGRTPLPGRLASSRPSGC
ncbi:hypothetical protein [Streptomyces sp. NPDC047841]|uniref:hypothetical protein n=1 Tax=Streptomyces sp. NPDC047841 TaxID=3154708 RepID=UPI0034513BA4